MTMISFWFGKSAQKLRREDLQKLWKTKIRNKKEIKSKNIFPKSDKKQHENVGYFAVLQYALKLDFIIEQTWSLEIGYLGYFLQDNFFPFFFFSVLRGCSDFIWKKCRRSSVDSTAPSILPPGFDSHAHHLFFYHFIFAFWNVEKTKIAKKRPEMDIFKKLVK